MIRVPVNPELLSWGRERADFAQEDLAATFKKLADWESGQAQPTLKQLEKFACAVHVPLGYLFLEEPPEEHLPIADFRSIADTAKAKASPDLIDTLYAMQRRQAWLREHFLETEAESPLPFAASARLADDPDAVGREMRRAVGLDEGWAAGVRTWQDAVNELRRMIERLGVMAVINGVVGNNTHRRLCVREFRGFALADRHAPLVFVNGADAKSAQTFTLAHELAHIWLGEEKVSPDSKACFPAARTWRIGATGRRPNSSFPCANCGNAGCTSGGNRIASRPLGGRSRWARRSPHVEPWTSGSSSAAPSSSSTSATSTGNAGAAQRSPEAIFTTTRMRVSASFSRPMRSERRWRGKSDSGRLMS